MRTNARFVCLLGDYLGLDISYNTLTVDSQKQLTIFPISEVRDLAKGLVTKWKKMVVSKVVQAKAQGSVKLLPKMESPAAPKEPVVDKADKQYKLGETGDDMRNRVQKMLHGVFSMCEGADGDAAIATACKCEEALFQKHGDSGGAYRAQIRVLLFNLKDPSNPDLKKNVLSGIISGHNLVHKDVAELASVALQEQREKEMKEAIDAARCDWENASDEGWSTMFQCPNCEGRKTKFKQKQIRGADEPMTTFLFCGDCQHRWTDGDH